LEPDDEILHLQLASEQIMVMKDYKNLRDRMVEAQIEARGVKDERVIKAMKKVPRHRFVPESMKGHAYNDEPLPIGEGQTISQPYIVAYMTECLQLKGPERVLEIGTGSGYQAAVLAELTQSVFTVELVRSLSLDAQKALNKMNYENISFLIGDGHLGWEEHAPFDAIIVTAAPKKIPVRLKDQLSVGGRLIIPVGEYFQELVLVTRRKKSYKKRTLIPVRFVPLVTMN
jgi:protein-L-isoaspartate(D-aspartate) O-methyltransferase